MQTDEISKQVESSVSHPRSTSMFRSNYFRQTGQKSEKQKSTNAIIQPWMKRRMNGNLNATRKYRKVETNGPAAPQITSHGTIVSNIKFLV